MASKKNAGDGEFIVVNVLYGDGTQRSNRKVPKSELSGYADEADIRRAIEAQDEKIAELSGQARRPIASIARVKTR